MLLFQHLCVSTALFSGVLFAPLVLANEQQAGSTWSWNNLVESGKELLNDIKSSPLTAEIHSLATVATQEALEYGTRLLKDAPEHIEKSARELTEDVKWAIESIVEDPTSAGKEAKYFVGKHPYATAVLATGVVYLAAPGILSSMGFGSAGPIKGSLAAHYQSSVYGAYVASGSPFAVLQGAGMGGAAAQPVYAAFAGVWGTGTFVIVQNL